MAKRHWRPRLSVVLSGALLATLALSLAGLVALRYLGPEIGFRRAALLLGGITNPIYALLIAYTNDFLPREQMAGASAGLIFLNGFGAIFGPTSTGWMMEQFGPSGFFLFIAALYIMLAGYAAYRMTRRAAPSVTGAFRGVTPGASPLAVEAVLEEAVKEDAPAA